MTKTIACEIMSRSGERERVIMRSCRLIVEERAVVAQ